MATPSQFVPAQDPLLKYDAEIRDIVNYVHDYRVVRIEAWDTARFALMDSFGCALDALRFVECQKVLKPIVPGIKVENGARVPGTSLILDPAAAAFNIGTMIRWLDFNDCWLAAEWGHPSDNLGAIVAVADWMAQTNRAAQRDVDQGYKKAEYKKVGNGKIPTVRDILEYMIKAYEIQGCLALENSFNKVGLDHVVLVKVASTAVCAKMLGLSKEQTANAITHAFADGQPLRTYRHSPNTMSRKSWAAGDACQRAVNLVFRVRAGDTGMPTVLSTPKWGFYDALFGGKKFKFQRAYSSYVMENILFKVPYPTEFHAQTAVEAAHKLYKRISGPGNPTVDRIQQIICRTHEPCLRIIDKQFEPLTNFADRDHCIQYAIAVMLCFGRLTVEDYADYCHAAMSLRVDDLRSKIKCVEDPQFTADYYNPKLRNTANALEVTFNDGSVMKEIVERPLGHRQRRDESWNALLKKFYEHCHVHFLDKYAPKDLMELHVNPDKLARMEFDRYMGLYFGKDKKFAANL